MRTDERTDTDDAAMTMLLQALYELDGFDARGYAVAPLRQRMRAMVRGWGSGTMEELRDRLLAEREAFAIRLSQPSLSMFRQPAFHLALRGHVIPLLRTYPSVDIWHVGCGSVEQIYATAIVLREEGVLGRSRIYATDAHAPTVARAQAATFPAALTTVEGRSYDRAGGRTNLFDHFTIENDRAVPHRALRDHIVFAQHDWAGDAPFKEFQLVICRDLMISFARTLQERMFGLIDASLCTFGMLAIGHGESLRLHPNADRYQELVAGSRVFRRTG